MLKNVSLFQNVPSEHLESLEKISLTRRYPKNTVLFMEGDENSNFYIIRTGKVCVYANDQAGKQVILNYMTEGESFGELALLDSRPRSASVITVTECELTIIAKTVFHDFLRREPEFSLTLMAALVTRIRSLTDNVKSLALSDVYGRVCEVLTRMCDDEKKIANPKLTHQDIAHMVGASREMVSKIMKELIIGGYIEQGSRYIAIKKTFPKDW